MDQYDMNAVWAMAGGSVQPSEFYEALKLHTFNLSRKTLKGRAVVAEHNSTLFMCPVVLSSDMARRSQATSNSAERSKLARLIASNIQRWIAYRSEVRLVAGFASYQGLVTQEPEYFRRLLSNLVWYTEDQGIKVGSAFATEELPADAPQLCFLMGSFTSLSEWPTTPGVHDLSSLDLRDKLKGTLRFQLETDTDHVSHCDSQIEVASPMFGDQAIECGLKMWLSKLGSEIGFKAWSVGQMQGDMIELQMLLNTDEGGKWISVPVRAHQVGVDGVERIIAHAAACTNVSHAVLQGVLN